MEQTLIARVTWKNGTTTTETHRYGSAEMMEVFTRDERDVLELGNTITKGTSVWVNATALALKALNGKG